MKQIIFNLPAGMADLPKKTSRESGGRKWSPTPVNGSLFPESNPVGDDGGGNHLFRTENRKGTWIPSAEVNPRHPKPGSFGSVLPRPGRGQGKYSWASWNKTRSSSFRTVMTSLPKPRHRL